MPRFNTYFIKNSIAFRAKKKTKTNIVNSIAYRASTVWNLFTPDLAKTSNVKNYTWMAFKSDKLPNVDFQAESPQTMPHNNNENFLYY